MIEQTGSHALMVLIDTKSRIFAPSIAQQQQQPRKKYLDTVAAYAASPLTMAGSET